MQFSTLHSISAIFYCGIIFSIVADVLVAISQVALLWKCRSNTPQTDTVIRTLIKYSINTGVLTSLCAVLMCITWVTLPNNLVYDIFFAALPTLLFNALLATLNARRELREAANAHGEAIPNVSSIHLPTSSIIFAHTISSHDDGMAVNHV